MSNKNDMMYRAIEVFTRGFCFTRSFTHPYLAEHIDGIWMMRDGPRKRGDYRREEWVPYGIAPKKVDQVVRKHARGHYCICAIHAVDESDEPLRKEYKGLGYRLGGTEEFMAHDLKRIPRCAAPVEVTRVRKEELAESVNKAAGSRQILPEHLVADAPVRCYTALHEDAPIGWVSSIDVGGMTWCANMYVKTEFRRRGIAKAMMCKMLRDDRKYGSELAVLTASHTGAMLYPVVGYQTLGTLLVYTPKKK